MLHKTAAKTLLESTDLFHLHTNKCHFT